MRAREFTNEKARSKAQQRFMGMVHAAQKGEEPASPEVAKVAKGMKKKDATDFAKTTHKGLPAHVGEGDVIQHKFQQKLAQKKGKFHNPDAEPPMPQDGGEPFDRFEVETHRSGKTGTVIGIRGDGYKEKVGTSTIEIANALAGAFNAGGYSDQEITKVPIGEVGPEQDMPMKISKIAGNKATIGSGIEIDLDQVDVSPNEKNPNGPMNIKSKSDVPGAPDPKKTLRPGSQVNIATESVADAMNDLEAEGVDALDSIAADYRINPEKLRSMWAARQEKKDTSANAPQIAKMNAKADAEKAARQEKWDAGEADRAEVMNVLTDYLKWAKSGMDPAKAPKIPGINEGMLANIKKNAGLIEVTQAQYSTEQQLRELYDLANKHGLYDAADVVMRFLER